MKKFFISKAWAKKLPKGEISPGGEPLVNTPEDPAQNVFAALDEAVAAAGNDLENPPVFVILDDIFAGKEGVTWDNTKEGKDVQRFFSTDAAATEKRNPAAGGEEPVFWSRAATSKIASARTLQWKLGTFEDNNPDSEDYMDEIGVVYARGFKNVVLHGINTEPAAGRKAEGAVIEGGGTSAVTHSFARNAKNPAKVSTIDKATISSSAAGSLTADEKARILCACGLFGDWDDSDEDAIGDFCKFFDAKLQFGEPGVEWYLDDNPIYSVFEELPGYATVSLSSGAHAGFLSSGTFSFSRLQEKVEDDAETTLKLIKKDASTRKASGKLTIDGASAGRALGYATVTILDGGTAEELSAGTTVKSQASTYNRTGKKDTITIKTSETESSSSGASGKLTIDGGAVKKVEKNGKVTGYAAVTVRNGGKIERDLTAGKQTESRTKTGTRIEKGGVITKKTGETESSSFSASGKLTAAGGGIVKSVYQYAAIEVTDGAILKVASNRGAGSSKLSKTAEYDTAADGGADVDTLKKETLSFSNKRSAAGSIVFDNVNITSWLEPGVYGFKSVVIDDSNFDDQSHFDAQSSLDSRKNTITKETKGDWKDLYKQVKEDYSMNGGGMTVKVSDSSCGDFRGATAFTATDRSSIGTIDAGWESEVSRKSKLTARGQDLKNIGYDYYSLSEIDLTTAATVECKSTKNSSAKMVVTLISSTAERIINAKKITGKGSTVEKAIFGKGRTETSEEYKFGLDEKGKKSEENALRGRWTEKWISDGSITLTDATIKGYQNEEEGRRQGIENYASVTLKNTIVGGDIIAGSYIKTAVYEKTEGLEKFKYTEEEEEDPDARAKTALGYMEELQNNAAPILSASGTLKLTGAMGCNEDYPTVNGSITGFRDVTISTYDFKFEGRKVCACALIHGSIDSSEYNPDGKIKTTLTITGNGDGFAHICKEGVKGFSNVNVKKDFSVSGNVAGTAGNDKFTVGKTAAMDIGMADGGSIDFGIDFGLGDDTLNVAGLMGIRGNLSFGEGKDALVVNGGLKIGGELTGLEKLSGSGDIAMAGENYDKALEAFKFSKVTNPAGSYLGYANASGKEGGKGPKLVQFENFASMEGFQGVKWEQADDVKARKIDLDRGEDGWLCGGCGDDANFTDTVDLLQLQIQGGGKVEINFEFTKKEDSLECFLDGESRGTINCGSGMKTVVSGALGALEDSKWHTLELRLGAESTGVITYSICRTYPHLK